MEVSIMFRNKTTFLLVLILALALFVEAANADYIFGTPTNLGPTVNSSFEDWGASISGDGLEMYFESNREGTYDIWVSTRANREDDWGAPMNLGAPVNTPEGETYPCISADGLELYFNNWGLWVARRATVSDPWGEPEKDSTINISTSIVGLTPSLSSDGLSLFLATFSPKEPWEDDWDLYVSTRPTRDDLWSEPVNLGPTVNGVNSTSLNYCPNISADGLLLFFASDRDGGYGRQDLWMTRRSTIDGPWSEPVNLGPTINSKNWEVEPEISADGRSLLFTSNRPGEFVDWDIYQVSIEPVVDFNGDGLVDAADMSILIDHWHTSDPLCDIGPMPWGDGMVDIQDMIVLSECLEPGFGRIAHWKLDETEGTVAYDSVGSDHANVHGDALWQPELGKLAGTLAFDGVDDYVAPMSILNPLDGPFRIMAWVRGGAPGQVTASQTPDEFMPGWIYLATDHADGTLVTELLVVSFPLDSGIVIADNEWYEVGLEWDGEHRHLLVNGDQVAVDEVPLPLPVMNYTGWLNIGTGPDTEPGSFWSGLIDDVRVYKQGRER